MKKTLMAGAASVALAAMPVVGVFATQATQTVTDTLEVTISSACSFKRYGAEATGQTAEVAPNWDGPTTEPTKDNDADLAQGAAFHKYTATLIPGQDVTLGTSSFIAYCNDAGGYVVSVSTPALTNASNDTINYSGSALSGDSAEGWTLKKDGSIFDNTVSNALFIDGSSGPSAATTTVTATATYDVYTATTTKAGTYTGNVQYTFTYNDPTA